MIDTAPSGEATNAKDDELSDTLAKEKNEKEKETELGSD